MRRERDSLEGSPGNVHQRDRRLRPHGGGRLRRARDRIARHFPRRCAEALDDIEVQQRVDQLAAGFGVVLVDRPPPSDLRGGEDDGHRRVAGHDREQDEPEPGPDHAGDHRAGKEGLQQHLQEYDVGAADGGLQARRAALDRAGECARAAVEAKRPPELEQMRQRRGRIARLRALHHRGGEDDPQLNEGETSEPGDRVADDQHDRGRTERSVRKSVHQPSHEQRSGRRQRRGDNRHRRDQDQAGLEAPAAVRPDIGAQCAQRGSVERRRCGHGSPFA